METERHHGAVLPCGLHRSSLHLYYSDPDPVTRQGHVDRGHHTASHVLPRQPADPSIGTLPLRPETTAISPPPPCQTLTTITAELGVDRRSVTPRCSVAASGGNRSEEQ